VPTIVQLLSQDYRTVVNCKELINAARDNDKIDKVIVAEANALIATWVEPEFQLKLVNFLQGLAKARKAKAKL